MTALPGPISRMGRLVTSWGIWPGLVMILGQWESARISGGSVPMRIALLTMAGTMAMYGTDRYLEKARLKAVEPRHELPAPFLLLMLVLALGLPALFFLEAREWRWLLLLGAGGFLYLAVTTRLIASPPLLKECLGAGCFAYLVWGLMPGEWPPVLAFWFLGLSNFMWSGFQDRARDRLNQVASLANRAPLVNRFAAVTSGLAAGLWFLSMRPDSLFGWTALLHGFWPVKRDWPIDLAFLPLVLGPLLHMAG